jgi:hypothetical protein
MLRTLLASASLFVLVPVSAFAQSPGVVACQPGTGGIVTCPCANNPSGLGRGCDNSMGTGGAALTATGVASLSADSVTFWASSIGTLGPTCSTPTQNVLCVLYTGQSSIPGGMLWGDGVLCCGGTYFPLVIGQSLNGDFVWPPPGTSAVSSTAIGLGDPLVPGSIRCYFVAYRDACPAFCTSSQRQKTSSYRITWLP